ncbi:hypothetical protein MIMGU_mgv1a018478mg, partial [Erythranthe guttata]
ENSPAHFLTKIEYFSLFSDYRIDKYETGEFEAGDYKWWFAMNYSSNFGDNYRDFISVYLAMAEIIYLPMNWEFNAIFTIYIYNQISEKYLGFRLKRGRRFNETKSEWGFPNFMSKNILKKKSNGYLLDGNLVLGAEVYIFKRQQVVERVTLLQPKMELYPKGDFSSYDNVVKINLVCVSAETFATYQKVKAKFCMRLIDGSNAVIQSCRNELLDSSGNLCPSHCIDELYSPLHYFRHVSPPYLRNYHPDQNPQILLIRISKPAP